MGDLTDIYASLNYFNGIPEHAKSTGEHTGWAMAGLGGDFIGLMQPVAQNMGSALGATRFAAAAATPIINVGLLTMMGMANTCGFGEPDQGQDFDGSAKAFQQVGEAHDGTTSPDTWEGTASDQYADRNAEQQRRAQELAEADQAVKSALASEAQQVDVARKMLDRCQTALALCIPVALAMNAVPGFGTAASVAFQAASVASTLGPSTLRYTQLIDQSAHTATQIRRAGATYDRIAEGAQQ
ncbi:EspA/EspE family type VII secretion system effector [Mycolicibacterium sediminis]|uniref:ESX-1 secretion-associated protein EspA/EspE-like domain-containing protein n=1 Tax=Mycolicibacterium sediminis TaxID=1286180 RepID=A0A7I7QN78_9MYCO|nr:EspA/EspE family type VII secretion system effector [Mycolicibacterium sediminis]BBY27848.1 hypothetical protein MSEDJ_19440 [Mycolicibacterium sediminis]